MRKSRTGWMLFLLGSLFGSCAAPEPSGIAPVAHLFEVSPVMVAGKDARIQVTLQSETGSGLDQAMLDAACFRIRLESGEVIIPSKEGIQAQPLSLGSQASLSRCMNLAGVLKSAKTQTAEVRWTYGGFQSDPLTVRIYAWDLSEIEAVFETNKGRMVAVFYPDKAPETVKNFVDLCLKGFYDGMTFHRVVSGFMIQGGCPNGDGTGDPGYFIRGEFNDLSHERGILSMARSQDPDSAGCQFFIMHGDNAQLDGLYAAFGKLVSGYDTLDRLAEVRVTHQRYGGESSRPIEKLMIEKLTIRPRTDQGSDS